jgi:hypothetical protein
MEILKFDESGPSSPSRKPFGRSAILVTFVALVFGAGTALASGTLTINNAENTIALDQGVANSVQCDDQIGVTLVAPYDTTVEDFLLTGVNITGINNADDKCLGKVFKIRVYDSKGNPSVFCNTSSDAGCGIDPDGTFAIKVVSGTSLNFIFTQGMRTGEPDPDSTENPKPRLVRVKNVTVESSDS